MTSKKKRDALEDPAPVCQVKAVRMVYWRILRLKPRSVCIKTCKFHGICSVIFHRETSGILNLEVPRNDFIPAAWQLLLTLSAHVLFWLAKKGDQQQPTTNNHSDMEPNISKGIQGGKPWPGNTAHPAWNLGQHRPGRRYRTDCGGKFQRHHLSPWKHQILERLLSRRGF